MEKPNPAKGKRGTPPASEPSAVAAAKVPPLFRNIDWLTFVITTLLVFVGYYLTLAPDVTLEDSGELAVASYYAGVPHPPGYPVWTIYTWLFTVLVPFSNIAWRVALSSAVAGALSCGLLALIVSRGSSMMIEGIAELKGIERRLENAICIVSGYVAGMLLGFNGFLWSQAVIVEVYTLSVLSLMVVLVFMLRWIYAPEKRRYLYWAFFAFGICFTNHQTLIVAAMGLEVLIVAVHPRLGRDLFLGNTIFYVLGLIAHAKGIVTAFDANPPLFMIYNLVGIGSLLICGYLTLKTEGLGTEWRPALILGGLWVAGAAFYFYMPLASMTNPPLNWGYPRTWEGFVHALTRGQYERANPTDIFKDPLRFIQQLYMYGAGAVEEFNLVYLLVAVVPFLFFRRMQSRERAWMIGITGVFLCLAVLLLIILNPSPDRQSIELNRPFFTASHVMIAMGVGYGLTLIAATLVTHYEEYRTRLLYGAAAAAMIAFYVVVVIYQGDKETFSLNRTMGLEPSFDPLIRFTALFSLVLALAALAIPALFKSRPPLSVLLALFAVLPVKSILSHWSNNEQRGHLFGYWFGHDMFTPPFGMYPEMARNTVLFGGTDPGRFNPTYMIFCESFIPASKKPNDPKFDRRDVSLITQNALADGTYLNYIRAHYNRSAQKDPPFFSEMLRTKNDVLLGRTNFVARMFRPLDNVFMSLGDRIEKDRREDGVYPPTEIITPTPEDSQRCFEEYIADAQRRLQLNQLKPGEDVRVVDNKIQVTGQVAVMAINGLLTKIIFDKNPDREFYVEESFPLDWMYPYLSPFGIIMKINRQPLPEISEEMLRQDHEFWTKYSERLTGNFITYDTTVKELCDYAERVYRRRDFNGFTGDRKFIRDDNAQKAFSKLRSAIGGLYRWRFTNAKTSAEQMRMFKEADFTFRQAFAFCPFSPEAVYRYIELLVAPGIGRLDDALLIAETAFKFDRENKSIRDLIEQLKVMKRNQGQVPAAGTTYDNLKVIEQQVAENPSNIHLAFTLATSYLQLQRTNAAMHLLDQLVTNPAADANAILSIAKAFADLGQTVRLETALRRLVDSMPTSAEAWYDLAAIQAIIGKQTEAMAALTRAVQLSNQRSLQQADAKNLAVEAAKDERFQALRGRPEFQNLTTPPNQRVP